MEQTDIEKIQQQVTGADLRGVNKGAGCLPGEHTGREGGREPGVRMASLAACLHHLDFI